MKKFYRLLTLTATMTLFLTSVFAQERTVSGKITDEEGVSMPGVNIIVKGTSTGTTTDGNGTYRISVPQGSDVLAFSFIGYVTQEVSVGSSTVIDLSMKADVRELSEVVVTALGVERSTKALSYSVTSVAGSQFQDARTNNLSDQLQGRIAGVNASKIASGPAGSSRVIIRGNKTLAGSNQPLYVVDGIPMDNSNYGNAGLWGGSDGGDGLTSINPDDIESITVLKGANAAALYGARAANGVINVITKKGTSRKGVGIDFNSNVMWENVVDLREYQKEFGQGAYVRSIPGDNTSPFIAVAPRTQTESKNWNTSSWGPRLGTGNFVDIWGKTQPYVDAGDNFDRFYETGYNMTNTLSLTGGSDAQNFRASFSDLRNKSITPNTGFNRQNATINVSSKFGEKQRLIMNSKVLYSHEFANNRTNLSDSPNNPHLSMYYIPTNNNVEWFKGDPNKLGAIPVGTDPASLAIWQEQEGWEVPSGEHLWHQNPYWVAHQFDNDDVRDRVIASTQLRYNITDWLYAQGRIGMDWYTRKDHDVNPEGTLHAASGSITEGERRSREINADWMLGSDKTFGVITVNAFVGGQIMRKSYEQLFLNGSDFNVPFLEVINNSVGRTFDYGINEMGINSLYGSASISYNNIFFLTATGRNDWFSVLNPATNSVFYPSVGGSFVFSDAFELPEVISFGKLRASWARVGNATIGAYETNLTYSLSGNTHLGYPMGSFSTAMGNNGLIPNPNLVPLESSEIELGFDMRFLDNRLGVDFTYYNQNTKKDILNATISTASGFGRTSVNVGELQNKGIEVLITGTPLRGPVQWDISLNMARNQNKVVKLIEGNNELLVEEPRSRNVFIKHIEGQPYGMITGRVQKLSPAGQPIFLSDGSPVQAPGFSILGNGVANLTGGLNNAFTYKAFNLSFLIDFKAGGDIFSGTNNRLTQAGLTEMSLQGREGEEALTLSGVTESGPSGSEVYTPFTKTYTPQEARDYWGDVGGETNAKTDLFVYDASFIKFRQLTFGYSFPKTMLSKTPFNSARLALTGRNLAILYKKTPNIDPESAYSSSNGQGLDYFGFPTTRSFGFDVKLGF